jgi:hypothetical protein
MIKRYSLCIFKTPVMHDKGEWVRYGDHEEILKKLNDCADKLAKQVINLEYKEGELDVNIDDYCLFGEEKNKWKSRFFTLLAINSVTIGYLLWTGLN